MTDADKLLALAAKIEAYTPTGRYEFDRDQEREFNEAIATAIGMALTIKVGDPALGNERWVPNRLPPFVTSLDEAMTLIGDEPWKVEDHPVIGISAVVGCEQGFGATPALSLVAACLRAHAERGRG